MLTPLSLYFPLSYACQFENLSHSGHSSFPFIPFSNSLLFPIFLSFDMFPTTTIRRIFVNSQREHVYCERRNRWMCTVGWTISLERLALNLSPISSTISSTASLLVVQPPSRSISCPETYRLFVKRRAPRWISVGHSPERPFNLTLRVRNVNYRIPLDSSSVAARRFLLFFPAVLRFYLDFS